MSELRSRLAVRTGVVIAAATGRRSAQIVRLAQAIQTWESRRVATWRRERLGALLRHCMRHVPYYAERFAAAGIVDDDLRDAPAALARLPPLTKDDLRGAGDRLAARDQVRKVRVATTSGSTGRPVTVSQDFDTAAWTRAVQERAFSWYGVHPLEPRVMLLAAPRTRAQRIKTRLIDLATHRRLFEFYDLAQPQLMEVARFLERYRPRFVTAYPSVLHELSWACVRGGIDLSAAGVGLLHTQSEMLLETQVESFRRAFGEVPVLNEYGCVEVGAMAYTCPEGGFHPSHDHVWLEVVDEEGRAVPVGQPGRVLLTPLHARAMPLLRYTIGDVAVLDDAPCACGRFAGQPVLQRVDGRTFDRIYDDRGAAYSAGMIHFFVRRAQAATEIREYLAVQHRKGELTFVMVPAPEAKPDLGARLKAAVEQQFAGRLSVVLEVVPEIPRDFRRKRSYFESRLT